jgi:hypothetical protein
MDVTQSSKFHIKLSDNIDTLTLVAPFLFGYRVCTIELKKTTKKQLTDQFEYELNHIPHEVDLLLKQSYQH